MSNQDGRRRESPGKMVDGLRNHVGARATIHLSDPVSTGGEELCDSGYIEIETVDEACVDVPGTTAEARFIAEGYVAKEVGDGDVESWRIAVKKFGDGWSQPTATGWYWDQEMYKSTSTVGVEAITLAAESGAERSPGELGANTQ